MTIVAGIDEAGYGPTLGPLVVSGVVFRLADDQAGACLWEVLSQSCAKTVSHPRKLVIADSKAVYRGRGGLAALERTALVMLRLSGQTPQTWMELLRVLSPGTCEELVQYPWYDEADFPIPVADGVGDIATRANAVDRDCRHKGVEFLWAHCQALPVGRYNRLVRATRNKAVVLLGTVLQIVHRILQSFPREGVVVQVDRLGGRTHYREPLTTAFPECEMRIIEESADRCSYELTGADRTWRIAFVRKGDSLHLPIALASMYSKYLRELFMRLLNRYWQQRDPALRSTAGYYQDARRWLADAALLLDREEVDRSLLVRDK